MSETPVHDTVTVKNFLGIPIQGNVYSVKRATQRTKEEFAELVQAFLAFDVVKEFGWTQYTPYFNDGEPCIFSARNLWVKTTEDTIPVTPACARCGRSCSACDDEYDEDDTYKLQIGSWSPHPILGGTPRATGPYVGEYEDEWRAALALTEAIEGGEFDHALLELFGDHTEVSITRERIKVDQYDHD